jgi:hypothetical protein
MVLDSEGADAAVYTKDLDGDSRYNRLDDVRDVKYYYQAFIKMLLETAP